MRQRFKPWAKEKLQEYPAIVAQNPAELKGRWHEYFGNNNPIHIEAGTGKGQFVTGMGKAHPDINYIGMEIYDSIIVSALEKIVVEDIGNVKIIRENAQKLTDFFEPGEVDRVYLNFSDPWPKNKHEKRRLTHEFFSPYLKPYLGKTAKSILKPTTRGCLNTRFTAFQNTAWF